MMKHRTKNIEIEVSSRFEADRSDPSRNYFFFSYHIRIHNIGGPRTRLMKRHWVITDGHGRVHEVKGDGVVGEQPLIEEGREFEYTSFCPLETSTGQMQGEYEMQTETGERFQAQIPPFVLMDPLSLN